MALPAVEGKDEVGGADSHMQLSPVLQTVRYACQDHLAKGKEKGRQCPHQSACLSGNPLHLCWHKFGSSVFGEVFI